MGAVAFTAHIRSGRSAGRGFLIVAADALPVKRPHGANGGIRLMAGDTPDVRIVLIEFPGIQYVVSLVIIHMMAHEAVIENNMRFMGKPHAFP